MSASASGIARLRHNAYRSAAAASNKRARSAPTIARLSVCNGLLARASAHALSRAFVLLDRWQYCDECHYVFSRNLTCFQNNLSDWLERRTNLDIEPRVRQW